MAMCPSVFQRCWCCIECWQDYSEIAVAYRPSHADATYDFKYGVRAIQVRVERCLSSPLLQGVLP